MPNSQLCHPKPPPNLPTICSFISFPFFLSTLPFFQCPRLQVVHYFLLMILRALSKIRLFHKSGWNSCKLMMMTLVGHPQGGGLTILPKWRYLLLGDLINGCQKCLRSHQIWLKLIILHQFSLSAKEVEAKQLRPLRYCHARSKDLFWHFSYQEVIISEKNMKETQQRNLLLYIVTQLPF